MERGTERGHGHAWATANLMRWLRQQLQERSPEREHLEAAVAYGDPAEARRVLAHAAFTDAQRRYVDDLLCRWEEALAERYDHPHAPSPDRDR